MIVIVGLSITMIIIITITIKHIGITIMTMINNHSSGPSRGPSCGPSAWTWLRAFVSALAWEVSGERSRQCPCHFCECLCRFCEGAVLATHTPKRFPNVCVRPVGDFLFVHIAVRIMSFWVIHSQLYIVCIDSPPHRGIATHTEFKHTDGVFLAR